MAAPKYVRAPKRLGEGVDPKIKAGNVYPITGWARGPVSLYGASFAIHRLGITCALLRGCAHLDGKNWIPCDRFGKRVKVQP
jgi:hypothetical protein